MRLSTALTTALLASFSLALAGCSSHDVETQEVDTAVADAKPAIRYAISAIDVPDQWTKNQAFAMNLDHDERGSLDNKVGSLIEVSEMYLKSSLQAHVDDELAAGRMNTIIELHSDGFGDQLDVAVELRPAVREDVGLRPAAVPGPLQRIYGRLQGGRFITRVPGQVWIELAMFSGQPPLPVELIGARLEGRVGPEGLTEVRIGGAITSTHVERDFAPTLYQLVQARVALLGPADPDAMALMQLFDTDKDRVIGLDEFIHSGTTQTLLRPDVDLADDSALPLFVPRPDGHRESLSLGIEVSATPLAF